VANLLTAAGVNRVLTLDLHAQQIQGFFDIPVDHLYAKPAFIQHLWERRIQPDVVVSPDIGGLKMASAYADALHADLAIVAKKRRSSTEIEVLSVIGEVEGRSVLIVDDLTESAGTITAAAEVLRKRGAREIYAGVTHAVLTDLAYERLQKSEIGELITSDSVPVATRPGCKITVVEIAQLLAEGIKRIHEDESVSSLFEIRRNESITSPESET
jgi:ribose-phosphate pyrophosphokinase